MAIFGKKIELLNLPEKFSLDKFPKIFMSISANFQKYIYFLRGNHRFPKDSFDSFEGLSIRSFFPKDWLSFPLAAMRV